MSLKQKKLNVLKTGDILDHFLLISKMEVKQTRNGKSYLDLVLQDDSINLPAKVWDNFESIADAAGKGAVVKVKGIIEEFNNSPQIKIDAIAKTKPEDSVSPKDFLPVSKRNFEEMKEEFRQVLHSIKNPYLNQLVKIVFNKEGVDKYLDVPAGKAWHHAYIHGLLEHTLEIIKICDLVSTFHKEINRDLLITGAVFHDFGKTVELNMDDGFDYTDKGRLLGHIFIAGSKIEKYISGIDGFPESLKDQLIHLILSHQGKLEFASPVEPKTLEAIVLYQADELSAKTNAYKLAIETDKENESGWTRFLPLAGNSLYIPKEDNNSDEKTTLF